jgi:cytochrome c oxidase subunit II
MSDQGHGTEGTGAADGHDEAQHVEENLHVEKWEGIWIRITAVMVVVFVLAIIISATAFGISVPGVSGRINPATLNDPGNPFAQPGIRELAPGKYEVYMVAQTWNFLPDKIEVPVGSEVTFHMTARDVTHGFKLADTNVNMMVLPGQISTLSAKFDKPGVYDYICHEYCGYVTGAPIGHHTMYGQLTVMPLHALTTTETGSDAETTNTMTETAPAMDTAAVTETVALTETVAVTETTPVADTAALTETSALTQTTDVTGTNSVTATAP